VPLNHRDLELRRIVKNLERMRHMVLGIGFPLLFDPPLPGSVGLRGRPGRYVRVMRFRCWTVARCHVPSVRLGEGAAGRDEAYPPPLVSREAGWATLGENSHCHIVSKKR